MSGLSTALLAVTGIALLYYGGDWLVRGASGLALRLGLTPLAIGLTVVAFGTSAPELVVSLSAVISGANDIAVGNVVGSNIANIGLILGSGAALRALEVHARLIRLDAPLMIGVALVMLWMLADSHVGRLEGLSLVCGLIGYISFTLLQARRESLRAEGEFASESRHDRGSLLHQSGLVVAGVLGLVFGGKAFVAAAISLALTLGISQATIGLTVVALGTSLPELAASLIAVARGHGDIALGNVIGSNMFNTLGILGITAVVTPLERGAVDWLSLSLMLGLSIALWPMLALGKRLTRPEGVALLLVYIGYVGWLAQHG